MKSLPVALLIVALMILVDSIPEHLARAQRSNSSESRQDKASIWMRHKLAATEKILEGMTRADYATIEKNAKSMMLMGFLEGWVRADMPEYKAQLQTFEYATSAIARAAHEKNLDGVTLAYTQLTISCTQCHKLVRDNPK